MRVQRYPGGMPKVAWICASCAKNLGGEFPGGHCATFHVGACGVCGGDKAVTEPSDYIWYSSAGCVGGDCE